MISYKISSLMVHCMLVFLNDNLMFDILYFPLLVTVFVRLQCINAARQDEAWEPAKEADSDHGASLLASSRKQGTTCCVNLACAYCLVAFYDYSTQIWQEQCVRDLPFSLLAEARIQAQSTGLPSIPRSCCSSACPSGLRVDGERWVVLQPYGGSNSRCGMNQCWARGFLGTSPSYMSAASESRRRSARSRLPYY